MDKKISVIIPVYNAEKYLLQTLNSVRFQTYTNLEIICVLDCPTDNSEEIVRETAAQDNRIKIVAHTKNKGLPAARNTGVENAGGEYIHFMDADDLLSPNFYETMLNMAVKHDADVSACSVFYQKKPKQSIWFKNNEIVLGKDKIHKSEVLFRGWAWRYLIKKEFWNKHLFSFPDLVPMEDIPIMISMIHQANKLVLSSNAIYFYQNRENSLLNQNKHKEYDSERKKQRRENVRKAKRAIKNLIRIYNIKRPNRRFNWLKERIKGKFICINDLIEYDNFKKQISVIIPIYNADKYLKETLNSIRFQTYRHLEIICVLDCPIDNSAKIVTEIAAEDSRIKLIEHIENKGLPAARKSGVENATGEYIHFMDADDILNPDFYEAMINAAEKSKCDVAACSVFYEKKPRKSIWFRKSEVLSDKDEKIKKTEVTLRGWAWRYLIKKEFWDEHQFSFPDLVPMEDTPVMIPMIYYANKVALCSGAVYIYKNRENSILNGNYDEALAKRRSENRHKARKIYKDFMKLHKIKQTNKWLCYLKKYMWS